MSKKPNVKIYKYQLNDLDDKSRKEEWNNRYRNLNIINQSNQRMKNIEYFEVFDRYLKNFYSSQKGITRSPRVLELSCGVAPFTRRAIEHNAFALATDYSEVLINRLTNELGYNAAVIDLFNINIANDKFDIIVLAGGIYESDDYTLPKKVYASIKKLLNENGIIIQYLNRYDNVANRLMSYHEKTRLLLNPKYYNFVRKLFGKKPLKKCHLLWLMPVSYVCNCATTEGLTVVSINPMRLICGVLDSIMYGFYPFKFFPFKDPDFFNDDSAERDKNKIFSRPFLSFINFISQRNKLCFELSKSCCIVFSNKKP